MAEIATRAGTIAYQEAGSGPVVVLVHGLLVDGALWSRVRDLLARDHRVVVPQLPLGSHTTPLNPDADLSPAGLASLIAEFLTALDLREVTLVGNDTGGAICQLVATDHPGRLARLVLTNCDAYRNFLPPAFRPLQALPRIPGAMRALVLTPMPLLRLAFRPLTLRALPRRTLEAWLAPVRADAKIRRDLGKVLRGITAKETRRAIATLRHFDRPTLIVWGPKDLFFRSSYAKRLAADIPGARLEWIPDARTFVPLDTPARLAELIGAFTASTPAPTVVTSAATNQTD